MPQVAAKILEVMEDSPAERNPERTVEQRVGLASAASLAVCASEAQEEEPEEA